MPTSDLKHFVTAIVVAHDGALWLPEVVASLSRQSREIDQIIAVDTGSIDGSLKLLKGAGIETLTMPRNTGFGAAISHALNEISSRASRQRSSRDDLTEWIWLIHDDCAPTANALEALLEAISDRPNVGMAGPKLRGWHDRNHLLEIGVSIAGNGARWTGLEYREQDQGQHDGVVEVLAVSTAGALIRRDVFEELEGFDPELTLFRDDVDFGWRVHTAGHSVIAVSEAIAYHAEAAANERRSIDVSDAYFHRPLLLDRRHAAYVLMSNSSFWLIPFVALQIFSAALVRSFGYLLAKLPGYALDELAAVALIILRPQAILRARKLRKRHRLVSSRVVSRFVPPRGSQFQLAFERAGSAISRSWAESSLYLRKDSEIYQPSALDLDESSLEDADIDLVKAPSPIKIVAKRPILSATLLVILISLIGFRSRLGDLVGGALPVVPESGIELLRSYVQSWHPVGLGSSANMPPWVALLGIASFITLGNAKALVALLFISAIPLAFLGAYQLARRFTELHFLALLAALLYAFSPVTLASVNSGRLATVVLIVIGPWLIRAMMGIEQLENLSWRKNWWLALLLTIVCSFSPLTFISIVIWQFILIILDVINFNSEKNSISKEVFDQRNLRRIALLGIPIVVNAPWSIEFILNPSRILLEPGLNFAGGSVISIFFGNPGGLGAPPFWLLSPLLFIAIIAIFVTRTARYGEVSLFFIAIAAIFGSRSLTGHGTFEPQNLWVGSLLVIPVLASLIAAIIMVDEYVPELSRVHLDYRHFLLGVTSLISALSIFSSLLWFIASGSNTPLHLNEKSALPAFLSASAQTDEKFKTLVFRSEGSTIKYFIARDRDVQLGDPDIVISLAPTVNKAIANLVVGAGADSSQVLAEFGVRYIFAARPINSDLVRIIDGIGGFTRSSSTNEGISWKVNGALGNLSFLSFEGEYQTFPTSSQSAQGKIDGPGVFILTEKFDERWKLVINGELIPLTRTANGVPRFVALEAGDFFLFHDGTSRRAWVSLQILTFSALVFLALPSRRRRSQMRVEELS
jgi:GT2 family glycosyltransferase